MIAPHDLGVCDRPPSQAGASPDSAADAKTLDPRIAGFLDAPSLHFDIPFNELKELMTGDQ